MDRFVVPPDLNVGRKSLTPARRAPKRRVLLCALGGGIAAMAARALAQEDRESFAVANVQEAMRLLETECPSVVIVGGDSCRAVADSCRQLRHAEACRDVVLLAVASERPEDVRDLLDAGADDVLIASFGEELVRIRLLVAQRAAANAQITFAGANAAQEELCVLSESLATTLDSIGDAVISTDLAGAVGRMNPAAERLTGWTLVEAVGRPLAEILPLVSDDTRAKVENPPDRALREGVAVSLPGHTLLVRRDGTEMPIADSCAPIRSSDGATDGAVIVFRDLTAKRDADALQASLQKQHVFADRMTAIGTLAAGAAHEINNPLSYALANIEMATEEIRSITGGSPSGRMKELEEMLREAHEGLGRITKTVRGLKTFSRLDEERPSVTNLVPVLDLSINMAHNEIRHRARLVKDYGPLPLVQVDAARLGQVFINLLVNAAHSMPVRSADTNELRVVTSTDAEGRAVVEVRDTGSGIPPALLGRIFDPFFTTKPIGVGTGLGLAISHSIVTGMGGEIAVESEVNRGTTFRVILPPAPALGVPSIPPSTRSKTTEVRRAAVLAIDDEASVGLVIRRVLRQHDVTAVTSAQEALDLLGCGQEFDVILSDLMMPGMSGMELYRKVVDTHPKMAPRVVFLTGGAFTAEAREFLDRVGNKCLEKPFAAERLREMVQKCAFSR
jgi:PAS domain S-box-containing protein